ncbi:TRAP transporter substrate-binding protein [Variovorax sp. PAMC 28711]|uniref:TRAP transporter substrate-binding protein n=1 Tax=Variovorax sp. PAMC 28711 TaxID=1795631 RepID=UPI00078BA6D1|nr:TRAP transporter substrate-binding protein [Variovorax sp. PAMC 28711]AMM23235.1 ABC transporter substrate-binding protein [Variovorax sp. PAMC 28711]
MTTYRDAVQCLKRLRSRAGVGVLPGWVLAALLCCGLSGVARAQPGPELRLRVVGGLAGVSQFTRHEERFWSHDLAALSNGRYSASIVPFDRAGVPGAEMLNLIRLGVIPFGTALLSQVAVEAPELAAPDLAGLSPDMATLRKVVSSFRPLLEKTLHERYGVEVLALYVYPAQVVFCKKPLDQLSDLAGRRVRVSGASQADFVLALKGVPVVTEFAELMSNMNSDNTQCTITGAMSGNMLGLHKITGALYTMPITWGLAVFGANQEAWTRLPPPLKTLLKTELPKLEAAVWAESERETLEGVACNAGADSCTRGSKGAMSVVRPSDADDKRRRDIFGREVLGAWVQRCGAGCVQVWDQSIGPAMGLKAPAVK